MPIDDRHRTPSIGTLAVMVERQRELRIYTVDGGHELHIMVAENYRPTLMVHDARTGGGPTGKSTEVKIRKPFTIDSIIAALEQAREQAKEQL